MNTATDVGKALAPADAFELETINLYNMSLYRLHLFSPNRRLSSFIWRLF